MQQTIYISMPLFPTSTPMLNWNLYVTRFPSITTFISLFIGEFPVYYRLMRISMSHMQENGDSGYYPNYRMSRLYSQCWWGEYNSFYHGFNMRIGCRLKKIVKTLLRKPRNNWNSTQNEIISIWILPSQQQLHR